jgi:hypothetical protein
MSNKSLYYFKVSPDNFVIFFNQSLANKIKYRVRQFSKKDGVCGFYERLPGGFYDLTSTNMDYRFVRRNPISDGMIRFEESEGGDILDEVKRMWALKYKFQEMKCIFKRGVLLAGTPGCGKTSLLNLLSSDILSTGGLVLNVSCSPSGIDFLLHGIREREPNRPIVLIWEDIDEYVKNYGEREVLAVLDGQNSIDNILTVGTTNYPENLDGRLINRPSRFDRVLIVRPPDERMRYEFLKQHNTGLSEKDLIKWAKLTKEFSFAHIKELIISVLIFGGDLCVEEKRLRNMFKAQDMSTGEKSMGFGDKPQTKFAGYKSDASYPFE